MEREANYAAVGAFVLLVAAAAALFVFWYSESREHRDYTRYEIYFDGSVSGLTQGAAVRYLGVDVGRVVAMHIDPRNASRVQVIVDIDSSTPISDRTVAEVALQGITGVLYIDLLQNSTGQSLGPVVASEEYPVIRSTHSSIDVLLASLPQLVALANNAFERVNEVLSDRNLTALSHAAGNIDQATSELPETLRQIRGLVADLRSTSSEFRSTTARVHGLADEAGPRLVTALDHIDQVTENLSASTGSLNKIVSENRADIRSFTRNGLPELERLLEESRAAASEIHDLAQSLRQNPSQILYQPPRQGVEIAP